MTSSADRQQGWDPDAGPGMAPPPAAGSEQLLVVNGERFLVSEHLDQGRRHVYSDDWLTGPNPGYGFGSSGSRQSMQDHTTAIRYFLPTSTPTRAPNPAVTRPSAALADRLRMPTRKRGGMLLYSAASSSASRASLSA